MHSINIQNYYHSEISSYYQKIKTQFPEKYQNFYITDHLIISADILLLGKEPPSCWKHSQKNIQDEIIYWQPILTKKEFELLYFQMNPEKWKKYIYTYYDFQKFQSSSFTLYIHDCIQDYHTHLFQKIFNLKNWSFWNLFWTFQSHEMPIKYQSFQVEFFIHILQKARPFLIIGTQNSLEQLVKTIKSNSQYYEKFYIAENLEDCETILAEYKEKRKPIILNFLSDFSLKQKKFLYIDILNLLLSFF